MNKDEFDDIAKRYLEKLDSEIKNPKKEFRENKEVIRSREYQQFRFERLPNSLNFYEKACNLSEKILKLKVDSKQEVQIKENLETCHLNVNPSGVVAFSMFGPLVFIILGILIFYPLFQDPFFIFFFVIVGLVMMNVLKKMPQLLADSWRLKASNQIVLSIFYIVTYMRHTSNLENAIGFAAEHLSPPLSLDLKKVLWDVESQKFSSIEDSLDFYLDRWRKTNLEFIEAMHLIESSLYEGNEKRRLSLLDKSLEVILDETYEKMLHYTHNLASPLTMLNMLGVVLPILGLVILPLALNFLPEIKWYYIAVLYNIVLPVSVYLLAKSILAKRPTGYGQQGITENEELLKLSKQKVGFGKMKFNPLTIALIIGILFAIIGLIPIIMHQIDSSQYYDFCLSQDMQIYTRYDLYDEAKRERVADCLLGYQCPGGERDCDDSELIGPFGLGATVLSVFLVLGMGLAIGIYFKLKNKNLIKIREETKKLENEFASAIFQLGSRLGDGIPSEIAFGKIAEVMKDTNSGRFFQKVDINLRKLGLGLPDAIFHPKVGAVVDFPSNVIQSSMKVLIQSAKKGPKVASKALISVSSYIKQIHRVNERLKDLLADTISSLKSQINFLTPIISGIVIGITAMITKILVQLRQNMQMMELEGDQTAGMQLEIFGDGIPTYYFQIIVGLYVIQIIYILIVMVNGIENGNDKLSEGYMIGSSLTRSIILYFLVSIVVMVTFSLIAGMVMTGTAAIG